MGNHGGRGGSATNSWVTEGLRGYRRGRLPGRQKAELLQQCGQRSAIAFGQGLEPFHKTMKQLHMPSDGRSLGRDGVAELVQVCWVSHGQFVLSRFTEDPDADSVEVTNIYY